ncbi:hypothetical protein BBJ28_00010526 [Nothophytophthora sp. Chile5]|nr:hypothetical protein BBJ28_00010526 [Nothophytophthora sp. Chile5]
MSVDATVRHVFGYDGGVGSSPPLQLADEHTLVYVSGHTLHFTSTVTRGQHFLLRSQPRQIVAFDVNWKTATFAVAAREPEAGIALYSYPDKKPRARLVFPRSVGHADEIFEYSWLKFSRCGRRLLSIRPAFSSDVEAAKARGPVLCVWNLETLTPVPGCESARLEGSARFATFDPTNVDQFVVGGDSGLQIWKAYTGKTAGSSLLRAKAVVLTPTEGDSSFSKQPEPVEWQEKREQIRCHAWLPGSRLLVASQAGELLLVDAVEASVLQVLDTATRFDHCPIAGIVATAETVVLAYADGGLAWLQTDNWELQRRTELPGVSEAVVSVLAPTPTHSKAYLGTQSGKIFEIRTSILQDDEDLDDEDEGSARRQTDSRGSSRSIGRGGSSSTESPLVMACGSFPTGPTCASTVLTPFNGAFAADAIVATGGTSGQLTLWGLRECRLAAEVNVAALFAQDPNTTGTSSSTGSFKSRPSTADTVPTESGGEASAVPPSVVISALEARPGDPVLVIGDHKGRLRALCIAKTMGGGGRVELLPQHSAQLLTLDTPLDLLAMHPTQAALLVASTQSGEVFLLSMDHEKRFPVLAFLKLQDADECVVDVQWTATSSSGSLALTCFSSRGRFYTTRYQAPPPEDVSVGGGAAGRRGLSPRSALQLVGNVVAFGESVLPSCARLRFLASPPSSMMLAVSPGSPELTLLTYLDVLTEPTEQTNILSKVLARAAHAGGVSALALFPRVLEGDVELLVTGGMDGAVTLWTIARASAGQTYRPSQRVGEAKPKPGNGWQLEDMQVTKKRTLVAHAGPVTTLRFVGPRASGGGDGMATGVPIQLISTGVDGCVFLLDVRLSPELLDASVQITEPMMAPLYMSVVACAKYDDVFQPEREQECTPFLEIRAIAEASAARDRFDRGKDATRAKLRELEGRLRLLLAENEKLPETEQLARDEFVLNVAWRDALRAQHVARAQRVREGIARELARMAVVRERMKREFWDSAEVPGVRLTALSLPPASSSVPPPPIPSPQPSTTTLFFVHNFPMRREPPEELKLAKQVALLRLIEVAHQQQEDRASTVTPARARFQNAIPNDLQWILDAGTLHPSAQQPQQQADGAAPASAEATDVISLPSFHLVYHPAVVRTRKQARMQIQLLRGYVRSLLAAFNAEFRELARLKESTMGQIEAKNARILEIHGELNPGSDAVELFRPQWSSEERADAILDVRLDEMRQRPYETVERRQQREREAHEAAEREKARQQDDVGGRALADMMDGTLEVKKDPLAAQELVKEAWMLATPVEDMTVEQKKLVVQFEAAQAKFEEEREKYRKSLDLELRKTRGEVTELCRGFDDKLRALRDRYLATRRAALSQETYELRLAEELLAREQLGLETQRLEDEARTLDEAVAVAQAESDRFLEQLEVCREDWHRSAEEDKALDKNFVRELEDVLNGSALEPPELVKQLVELYRKRKADDLVLAQDGVSGGDVAKRTTSAAAGSRAKPNAKQRLLAESAAGDGSSSRSLAATSTLQGLKQSASSNVLSTELNLDPFQDLDTPQQQQQQAQRGSARGGSQKLMVVPLDYEVDRPEGLLLEDRVWRALNELRSRKILLEHATREKSELLTLAKTVSDELRVKLMELQRQQKRQQREREALAQRRTALTESAPLLVRIKQGQDETPAGGNDDDALLVTRTSVEALNDVIQLHGKDQVGVLARIKDFRKSINVMEWEHALLELQLCDMDERYTDIQLLRVTKDLQELFHTGDTSHKHKREAAMLEAKLAHLGKHQQTSLLKLERTGEQLNRQRRERERENRAFEQQVATLEMQVQIREDILASRTSAAARQQSHEAASGGGAAARLKAISVRRKLVDLAKAQTNEIEFLRLELDKMRRRTFPSFAHAHSRDYQDVD